LHFFPRFDLENIGFLRIRVDANIAKTLGFSLLSSAIAPSFPRIFLGFQSASIALLMLPKTGRRVGNFFTNLARREVTPKQKENFFHQRFGSVWPGLARAGPGWPGLARLKIDQT
jgi:hypothetical protein